MSAVQTLMTQHDANAMRKRMTTKLLRAVQDVGEDFEWYPTDLPQIECIKADLLQHYAARDTVGRAYCSVLDCGAGDGRVLEALTNGDRFAIERSVRLVEAMDKSIFVIGSDFHNNTLMDKQTDVVFSNPPYSEFEIWAQKIILEANAAFIYLILPNRWSKSNAITNSIAIRSAKVTVLDSFDYLGADRVARAKVDVIKLTLGRARYEHSSPTRTSSSDDPFNVWFDSNFPLEAPTNEISESRNRRIFEENLNEAVTTNSEVVKKEGLVRLLDKLYQRDMDKLMETYQAMTKLPSDLLKELDVNITGVKASLRLKIKSLKDVYWRKLFENLDSVTDKLTHKSREALLSKLTARTDVDFNEANAVVIVIWVIKQANIYFEDQIVEVYQQLTELANVQQYKSNQRTIQADRWRYASDRFTELGPYGLDYRIVLERIGGYDSCSWRRTSGLDGRALVLVQDLVTIAGNIGFDAVGNTHASERTWLPGKPQLYYFFDHTTQKKEVLFDVKAFKNGNLHLRMHQRFIQKLNIVHGRLKGWLRSAADAVQEMDVAQNVAEESFAVSLRISFTDVPLLQHFE